jgi:hypothetical protein
VTRLSVLNYAALAFLTKACKALPVSEQISGLWTQLLSRQCLRHKYHVAAAVLAVVIASMSANAHCIRVMFTDWNWSFVVSLSL